MLCKRAPGDRLLDALVKQGINLVVPPRDDLEPGDLILGVDADTVRRASWGAVFGLDVDPKPKSDGSFRACTFGASDKLEVSTGATLIGAVLSGFGMSGAKVSAALKTRGAHKLELSLVAPATRSLDDLDGILDLLEEKAAVPKPRYDGAAFFVITKVWRAKGLRLSVLDGAGATVKLDAKAMEELTAQGAISFERESDGRYAYVADSALVFGVNLRMIYSTDHGLVRDAPVDHHLVFRAMKPADPKDALIGEDAFVRIVDDVEPEGDQVPEGNSEAGSKTSRL